MSAASAVWNTALSAADTAYVATLANANETHAGATTQADARLQRATEQKDVREDYVAVAGADRVFDEEGGADGGDSSDKTELPTPLQDPLDQGLLEAWLSQEDTRELPTARSFGGMTRTNICHNQKSDTQILAGRGNRRWLEVAGFMKEQTRCFQSCHRRPWAVNSVSV